MLLRLVRALLMVAVSSTIQTVLASSNYVPYKAELPNINSSVAHRQKHTRVESELSGASYNPKDEDTHYRQTYCNQKTDRVTNKGKPKQDEHFRIQRFFIF